MKQYYSIKDFTPSQKTLDAIRQFAHTYKANVHNNDKCIPFLMTLTTQHK